MNLFLVKKNAGFENVDQSVLNYIELWATRLKAMHATVKKSIRCETGIAVTSISVVFWTLCNPQIETNIYE